MAVTDRFWRVTLKLSHGAVMMFSVTGATRQDAAAAMFHHLLGNGPAPSKISDIKMHQQAHHVKP
jgi:hypothetical protein